jgi:hypothetical protein
VEEEKEFVEGKHTETNRRGEERGRETNKKI